MKRFLVCLVLFCGLTAQAAQPWKQPDPEMTKAPPTELEKKISAMPDAKLPAKKPKPKKLPGAAIGMTQDEVMYKTNWGKPNRVSRTINRDGTFEWWMYDTCRGEQILYFEDGYLEEIQQ